MRNLQFVLFSTNGQIYGGDFAKFRCLLRICELYLSFFFRIRPAYEDKQEAVLTALLKRTFTDHVIVFIKTKAQCHRLHIILGLLGLRAAQLHGNMSQAQRLESLKLFKEEQIDILLTTDVAARGLDISGVQTVINFQLPNNLEQYIHRVGRTARAGM